MKAVQLFAKMLLLVIVTGVYLPVFAQPGSIQLALEPVTLPELQGLQSFAFGQYNGKWPLLGNPIDGLHRQLSASNNVQ